jgi:hypothetical protein
MVDIGLLFPAQERETSATDPCAHAAAVRNGWVSDGVASVSDPNLWRTRRGLRDWRGSWVEGPGSCCRAHALPATLAWLSGWGSARRQRRCRHRGSSAPEGVTWSEWISWLQCATGSGLAAAASVARRRQRRHSVAGLGRSYSGDLLALVGGGERWLEPARRGDWRAGEFAGCGRRSGNPQSLGV